MGTPARVNWSLVATWGGGESGTCRTGALGGGVSPGGQAASVGGKGSSWQAGPLGKARGVGEHPQPALNS